MAVKVLRYRPPELLLKINEAIYIEDTDEATGMYYKHLTIVNDPSRL
jgi:hypothetical protein